jgi:hypothetical protein
MQVKVIVLFLVQVIQGVFTTSHATLTPRRLQERHGVRSSILRVLKPLHGFQFLLLNHTHGRLYRLHLLLKLDVPVDIRLFARMLQVALL